MKLHAAIQNVRLYLRDMEHAGRFADDQLVAVAPPVPPDGGSSAEITISDLRAVIERHHKDRWNIYEDGADVLICRGLHDKAAPCDFERYVPADALPFKGSIVSAWLAEQEESARGRAADCRPNSAQEHWHRAQAAAYEAAHAYAVVRLHRDPASQATPVAGVEGEAQRLAALVTALGGNPEPDAPQPLEAPGAERYRNRTSELPAGVADHLQHRLDAISAIWEANGQPDRGHIAFLLRIARSYVGLPNVTEAAIERAEICKVLGIVDKPGVPLRHVQDILARKAKAHEREIKLLKSWDRANPTERQELDRMRRGWGPSSPTERMRRKSDVLGCLQAVTSAMSELAVDEEDAERIGEEAQAFLDAAHDRLDKWHTAAMAIVRGMNDDPQEWPDIRAAEERGAMAMRRILEERVSGLEIIEKPTLDCWKLENVGVARALSAVKSAPLPRDYHGPARDDVATILG